MKAIRPRLERLEDRTAPAVLTVNTTADDLTPNDGSVSLREAITAINAGNDLGDPNIIAQNPGGFSSNDTINFNISGSAVQTINIGSTGNGALPTLVKKVNINGYSQTGASVNTLANGDNAIILIELNGANAGANADGLLLGAGSGGSTISGLAINRFSANGIELQTATNIIRGNFIGINPQGTAQEPNQLDGIRVSNTSNNTLGGITPDTRNIVSGNGNDGIHIVGISVALLTTGNLVVGNFVGTNAAGTGSVGIKPNGGSAGTPSGNSLFGIEVSGGTGNTIGGLVAGSRNVVGFNIDGIEIDNGGQNNVIQGNFTGVGADGTTPIGNILHGIALRSSDNLSAPLGPGQANEPAVSGNSIGGTASGSGNLVEFNGTSGIAIFGNPLPNNATSAQNSGNSILGNSIFQNGRSSPSSLIGIDLSNKFVFPKDDGETANDGGTPAHGGASDPNNFQNAPALTGVTLGGGSVTITGMLTQSVSPTTQYRIEFFANNTDPLNGAAEGQTFLGFTTVTATGGSAAFSVTLNASVKGGQFITATATNLTADPSSPAGSVNVGNTSEFSAGFLVKIPPAITSAATATFAQGTVGTFTITTTGSPSAAVSENGVLPPNVSFKDNGDGTATLTGTPITSGNFPFTIMAANGSLPDATQSFVLTVTIPPTFTSPDAVTFAVGRSTPFTVTTTGFPTAALTETGALPGGVTFKDNGDGTATLTGTPTASGTYSFVITAANGTAINASQSFTMTLMTAQERFVNALYRDELGRTGSMAELDSWVSLLSAPGGSQAFIARGIQHSQEGRDYLVRGWYQAYLGRTAVNGEEQSWVNLLLGGQSEEQVLSQILGTVEFFNRAQVLSNSGTPQQIFVQELYQVLLHRMGSATDVAFWTNLLPTLGQNGVALAFMTGVSGTEFRTDTAAGYYINFLRRPTLDMAGANFWGSLGIGVEDIRTQFEATGEFFTNS